MKIIKRDGSEQQFEVGKICSALSRANKSVPEHSRISNEQITVIISTIESLCRTSTHILSVEDIQDAIEYNLMKLGLYELAKKYITYRYEHERARSANTTDDALMSLRNNNNELIKQENANKAPEINSTMRDYIAGITCKDIASRKILPKEILEAHDEKIIHWHDLDYSPTMPMYNCCLINLEDMLQNGTVISKVKIDTPHTFATAANITTQILAQVASNQYGGQSLTLTHIAPFVNKSRLRLREKVKEELSSNGIEAVTEEQINSIAEARVRAEVASGVQTIQYQILTLQTTNGQAPFASIFIYLNEAKDAQTKADLALIAEEVFKQRRQGVKNDKGVWVTNPFPKLLYVLEEDNIREDSPYYYLTKLAASCTAKRMVPDFISEKLFKKYKDGNCFPVMGCRSCLSVWKDEQGNPKFYGRFNCGVVTINLPDVALSCGQDVSKFWGLFDERLELCHRALQFRHKCLRGIKSDVAPILWQHGAIARLKPGETIDKMLYGGYSTISLGYAGLWECVYALIGKKLTEPEGKELGLRIMRKMNECIDRWKAEENIGYALYGTPEESTTYDFAKALQRRFGVIKGVSDKNYITNSYHVHVTEHISAFDKIKLESEFQVLSLGGAISYVEVTNMQKNIEAVLTVMKYIYDNLLYGELNSSGGDYCGRCGFDQEIELVKDESGKLIWKCPNCGNTDKNTMSITRRVCGYLSSGNDLNQGRLADIHDRVLHL